MERIPMRRVYASACVAAIARAVGLSRRRVDAASHLIGDEIDFCNSTG
jgi:hypothetical protein